MSETSLQPGTYASATPEHPAAIDFATGLVLTYRDLEDRSRRLAGLWRQRGLRPGDHVAVLLDNQSRYFEVAWAAQRSGLYLTPVKWHLGAGEAGDDGADLADALRVYCRERLAGFKVPREVVFVDELPRLPTGKIRKSELRSQYGTWSGTAIAHADR